MALEKQKAEEKQGETQEGQGNDLSKDEHSEPATDELPETHKSELDQAVGDGDQTPNEQSETSSEKATLPQKNMTETSEKVTNSREKRESRRQRGLEHNELQNKHVLLSLEGPSPLCHEEQTSPEEALGIVPMQEKSTAEDPVLQGSRAGERSPIEEKVISDMALSSKLKENSSIPEQPPVSEVNKAVDRMKTQGNQNNQIKGSQSFNCPERPTNLALNLHNTLSATESFQTPSECWTDKNKRLVQKAAKDLDSPTSSPIQRYVDDPGKLKYKREKWKGKRQSDAGHNDMLSQSLDERTRVDKSPQDQLE